LFYVSNGAGSMDVWQQAVSDDGQPVGDAIALTHGLGVTSAVFSPDGRRLAYSRGGPVSNVWRVPIMADRPATWADATPVTSEQARIEFLDISPDGQRLAISSDRRGNHDLWLLPAGGGEMTPITTDPTPDWNPRWSPDGREIAFYSYRSGNRDIWVMPSGGGPARQLTSDPATDRYPAWSPDGRAIAFDSQRDGESSIWIVSAGGGDARRLAAGRGFVEWSPDGRWLAFSRGESLYRVPTDGGEATLIGPGYTPHFSADGQSLYYNTGPIEDQDIWSRSLTTGAVSRLTKLQGRRGQLGYTLTADARYLYFNWSEPIGDIWVMDAVDDSQ
jgi:Tol biopolymer transport system component